MLARRVISSEALRTIAGRFRIQEEVAAGGMGRVYRALDVQTGDLVAVKLLRSREVMEPDRFALEAALLASLEHPGIVRHVAHGSEDDFQYLVMEWAAGETFAERTGHCLHGVDDEQLRFHRIDVAEHRFRRIDQLDSAAANLLGESGDPLGSHLRCAGTAHHDARTLDPLIRIHARMIEAARELDRVR